MKRELSYRIEGGRTWRAAMKEFANSSTGQPSRNFLSETPHQCWSFTGCNKVVAQTSCKCRQSRWQRRNIEQTFVVEQNDIAQAYRDQA